MTGESRASGRTTNSHKHRDDTTIESAPLVVSRAFFETTSVC
jgi:hypothetical protein